MKSQIITDIKMLKQKSEPLSIAQLDPANTIIGKTVADMIIQDLEDSLDLKRGIGLTAIQIGIPKKVAIIRMPNLKLNLINPILLEKFYRFRFQGEKCLSLPGLSIDTARYMDITIKNGDGRTLSFYGLEAVVCLHELDHMKGLLIIDRKWRKR